MKPHLHFMGIAGVGMSGLARWYLADGYRVSGCDALESPELHTLRRQGIEAHLGHDPAHVAHADLLVTSTAIPEAHPEVQAARAQGKRTLRRIELLAELLNRRRSVAVTGTHGKSTTTGMIATLFLKAGCDPSVLVGGHLAALGSNVRYGHGAWIIAEVDESDPGFAALPSELAVVTNLEDDHIAGDFSERRNYHASLEALEAATASFAARSERVLFCADWPSLGPLLGGLPNAVTYGLSEGASYRASVCALSAAGSHFTFHAPHTPPVEVRLLVPGRHNVQNAAAALAAAHLAGLDLKAAAEHLSTFGGVGRRWQRRGSVRGALVIDDYAHHPTEVRVTLEAARHTGRRVRAVLQPHRWVRTARHWPALADAAALADEVLVLEVYGAGEAAIPGVSARRIVERLQAAGTPASFHSAASAQSYLAESLEQNDLVITLGAGDVWEVAEGVVALAGGDDGSA
ncbi:UDP-N-acetylmuramate--L-alanine ligase [Truepera radiovictrix]|uniref:UDP-N-acetylmuramate--L-alanine ligase n=1 Tax=Truepera radiovictrix (strain DSM 17093 / CIP 108686 / LMG 22925 / RQ-24) TaxID=649638 RepID=D7CY87_TRURR|nr:UDP-N-acetylmuramate--L-alanine ligase [Truepera radiovictrix]ADI14726.1 UDP-N-acetylmuramate/alanine ligase [Truepera radiovictrix DSM 17093]WMT56724.1 UDP-N-acetylmuramate--L-alanine ligase [Truepera radiovictrix]